MSSLPFWSSSWGQSLDWFVPRLSAVAVGPTPNGRASWRAATVLVARSVRRGGPELPFRTFCTVVVTLPRPPQYSGNIAVRLGRCPSEKIDPADRAALEQLVRYGLAVVVTFDGEPHYALGSRFTELAPEW
jgi:hypothetical protein